MSLSRLCRDSSVCRVPVTISWNKVASVHRQIERRWADRPVHTPPPFELEQVKAFIVKAWNEDRALETVPRRHARWLPHVLFHPETDRRSWLATDTPFLRAALKVIRQRERSISSLLYVVLRVWPVELKGGRELLSALSAALEASQSVRLREWRRRAVDHWLTSEEGPDRLAQRWRKSPARRGEILADAGLDGQLATSEFVAAAHRNLLQSLAADVANERYAPLHDVLQLLAPGGALAFPHLGGEIATAPLERSTPATHLQKSRRPFKAFS